MTNRADLEALIHIFVLGTMALICIVANQPQMSVTFSVGAIVISALKARAHATKGETDDR